MITWSIRKVSQPLGTAGVPMNIEISFFEMSGKEYDVSSIIRTTHLQNSYSDLSASSLY
jgi:hypothetical protein